MWWPLLSAWGCLSPRTAALPYGLMLTRAHQHILMCSLAVARARQVSGAGTARLPAPRCFGLHPYLRTKVQRPLSCRGCPVILVLCVSFGFAVLHPCPGFWMSTKGSPGQILGADIICQFTSYVLIPPSPFTARQEKWETYKFLLPWQP